MPAEEALGRHLKRFLIQRIRGVPVFILLTYVYATQVHMFHFWLPFLGLFEREILDGAPGYLVLHLRELDFASHVEALLELFEQRELVQLAEVHIEFST